MTNQSLTKIDDKSLVETIKVNHDENALKELMSRHTGLYNSMVNKIIDNSNPTLKNDILEQKAYNFYTFALDYNPERNMSFATYLGERTKFLCWLFRKKSNKVAFDEITENIPSNISTTKLVETKDSAKDILEMVGQQEDKRFEQIVNLRFFSSDGTLPWRDVAEKMGLSIEGARKIYNKHIKKIRKNLKKQNE